MAAARQVAAHSRRAGTQAGRKQRLKPRMAGRCPRARGGAGAELEVPSRQVRPDKTASQCTPEC